MASSQLTVGSGDHHVLALHGWFGSARGWGSLPDYLDRSRYTYVFMDLRGYGGRKQDPGDFTMEEAAADGRLGISQAIRGRIRDLGGSVGITSAPGTGTEVRLHVPRRGEPPASGRAAG